MNRRTAPPKKEMTWAEAITKVLAAATEPMHYSDIATKIAEEGLRSKLGATPNATVGSLLAVEIKTKKGESQFVRAGKGTYTLRSNASNATDPDYEHEEDQPPNSETTIRCFGVLWERDQVHWEPSNPSILGQQTPKATPANFGPERGVYLLHDRNRVVYVGKVVDQDLGVRLRQHTQDRLRGRWDRFSWFGIREVDDQGKVKAASGAPVTPDQLISILEAVLIEALEPFQNRRQGDGLAPAEYLQVADTAVKKAALISAIEKL